MPVVKLARSILLVLAALSPLGMSYLAQAQAGGAPGSKAASTYFIELLAERRVDDLPPDPLYWQLEDFKTAEEARAAAGPLSLTATTSKRHWLFTLGPRGKRSPRGSLIAEIGPVARPSATTYLIRINLAGGPPGSRTPVHSHPGSEAIYVLKGRVSQRTPHGTQYANAGGVLNAHAPEMAMQLSSSGATELEQVVMFLVDADRPFSPVARF
ncbi:MAG TPA: hypothetical protein VM900_07200 [Sphingomonas sp.]|nr:hypothetical protein [Sphingomonas sp.]